ncbi:MAG TPA: hypothetical protein VMP67_02050 [Candidatus Limnocylindria bacterium]|nr:hypothetical protein [Candidatus Limnocylindria bacterium]
MEQQDEAPILAGLPDADLLGLRLAAQVMTHKAELAGRALVATYFARLEESVQAELASRLTGISALLGQLPLTLDGSADEGDRQLVGEYLGLLIGNERLSAQVREACRRLRQRTAEQANGEGQRQLRQQ